MKLKTLAITFICIIIAFLVSCSPIKEIRNIDIEATIEYLYIFEGEYYVVLNFTESVSTTYKGELFYKYCKDKLGETLPATLELTFMRSGVIDYRIIPIIE